MRTDECVYAHGKSKEECDAKAQPSANATIEISCYVLEIINGLRRVTKGAGPKDIVFLDYLLAMAEDEASRLSSCAFH